MAEATGDSGWQRHWEVGMLLVKYKCLQKPEWISCMLSRSRLSSALRNLWLPQHCPADKIYVDPWFSWTEIEEHFRASLNLPFTVLFPSPSHTSTNSGGKPEEDTSHVTMSQVSWSPARWLSHSYFLLQHLVAAKLFNSLLYWSQHQWFHWQSFFWHWQDRRKLLIKINREFWIRETENSGYLIKDGVSERLLWQHCQDCSNCLLCQLMRLQAVLFRWSNGQVFHKAS